MLKFDDVYAWLNHKEDKSHLSDPVSQIVQQIKGNLAEVLQYEPAKQDFSEVNRLISLSIEVSESLSLVSGHVERAETHFECAYVSYKMRDITRSIIEFRKAIRSYRAIHEHNEAVARWLIGCAYWRRAKQSEAIVEWQRSCHTFDSLRETDGTDWYQEQLDKMCETMRLSIEHGHWPYNENSNESDESTP